MTRTPLEVIHAIVWKMSDEDFGSARYSDPRRDPRGCLGDRGPVSNAVGTIGRRRREGADTRVAPHGDRHQQDGANPGPPTLRTRPRTPT